MRGHIQKRGTKYSFIVTLGYDNRTGRRKQKRVSGFKRKEDAEKAMNRMIAEIEAGEYQEPDKTSFEDYLQSWIHNKRNSIEAGTLKGYQNSINLHINEYLGHVTLSELRVDMFDTFYDHLYTEKNLSATSIKKIHHSICKASLNAAVKKGKLKNNPAALADLPSGKSPAIKVWDRDEVKHFLKVAEGTQYYIAFHLALATGMRQGEILALKWDQIDVRRKTLSIEGSLKRDMTIGSTKTTTGKRLVSIPQETIDALIRHDKKQKEDKLRAGSVYKDNNIVVATSLGTHLSPRNLVRTWFKLLDISKNPKIRFHDLRHTHATQLLRLNFHPKVVQERLGHSSVQVTIDTYSHLLPGLQEAAAKEIGTELFSDDYAKTVTGLVT
ncbi:tyrosine-type recombinase/integrase [Geomicrobium sediminis]|uniref:Integrase n=1 Tax=Geomicrobium sediminis TaxID=1347788 RepID=A0ABS2PGB8_9BACL|nr:tyrosine-type recombinase/integrase [Geomicrobium sediminis]MBM7634026.1 integrase [Geomicrobium sediminis]